MNSALDQYLMGLVERFPTWRSVLPPQEAELVEARLAGLSLTDLAERAGLTVAGLRHRLYGGGAGLKRRGGALGRLQAAWRALRR